MIYLAGRPRIAWDAVTYHPDCLHTGDQASDMWPAQGMYMIPTLLPSSASPSEVSLYRPYACNP